MLIQCLDACMHTTIPTTAMWWGQGGKPPSIMNFSVRIFICKYCLLAFYPCTQSAQLSIRPYEEHVWMPRSYRLILVAVIFYIS